MPQHKFHYQQISSARRCHKRQENRHFAFDWNVVWWGICCFLSTASAGIYSYWLPTSSCWVCSEFWSPLESWRPCSHFNIIYSATSPKYWLHINHLRISCQQNFSTCKMHQSIDYLQNWSCTKTVLLVIWALEQVYHQLLSVIYHWWPQRTSWATWWPQQWQQRLPVFTGSGA